MTRLATRGNSPRSIRLAGVILAGGRARRMGGQDKGLLPLRGEPLIAHALRRLRPQVDVITINANRNIEQYSEYNQNVIKDPDDTGDYSGPLAGMLAALQWLDDPNALLLTAPCDSPLLAADYGERMYAALTADQAEIAVACSAPESAQRSHLQPVFTLLSARLAGSLHHYLNSGGRKIDIWLRQHKLCTVDFSDRPMMFENINTPEDLTKIETLLQNDSDFS